MVKSCPDCSGACYSGLVKDGKCGACHGYRVGCLKCNDTRVCSTCNGNGVIPDRSLGAKIMFTLMFFIYAAGGILGSTFLLGVIFISNGIFGLRFYTPFWLFVAVVVYHHLKKMDREDEEHFFKRAHDARTQEMVAIECSSCTEESSFLQGQFVSTGKCPECKGKCILKIPGHTWRDDRVGFDLYTCGTCGGDGKCPKCHGNLVIRIPKT